MGGTSACEAIVPRSIWIVVYSHRWIICLSVQLSSKGILYIRRIANSSLLISHWSRTYCLRFGIFCLTGDRNSVWDKIDELLLYSSNLCNFLALVEREERRPSSPLRRSSTLRRNSSDSRFMSAKSWMVRDIVFPTDPAQKHPTQQSH